MRRYIGFALGVVAMTTVVVVSVAPTSTEAVSTQNSPATTTIWTAAKSRTALGGSFYTASRTGASATFAVKRKTFRMWYVAGPANGKLAVLVNGKRVATVDQYSPRAIKRSVRLRGTKKTNVVQVIVLSTRNKSSRGIKVNVDAFGPNTSLCKAGCVRSPRPTVQQAGMMVSAAEAIWYPSAVPARNSPDWPVAIGSYVRGRDVLPIDTAVPVIRAAACAHARRVSRGVVILSFGRPVAVGASGFGQAITYAQMQATAAAWSAGLAECGVGPWEVSIGTSNSGRVDKYNGFAGGVSWGRMIEGAQTMADPRVSISGAVDIEPGWGPAGNARAWVDGYVSATQIRLWNFGSADGCPQTVSAKFTCNNGWTIDDVLWVNSHAGPNVVAMPQIHTQSGSQARQWAVLAARGIALGKPLRLAAITVQTAACTQVRGGCPTTGVSAWDGWTQLRTYLDANPTTVGTPLGAPMDIRWGWANGFVIPPATTTTTTTTTTVPPTTTTTIRPASADANLTALTISTSRLDEVFSNDVAAYTGKVDNSVASIKVKATAQNGFAVIRVNDVVTASCVDSADIPLVVGANTITVTSTSENGATVKTFTLTITREASSVNTLSNLTLDVGTLTPVFSEGVLEYSVQVPSGTSSLAVVPTSSSASASIKVNTVSVVSGAPRIVNLEVSGATVIDVEVTAQNGAIKMYVITVTHSS
jgi:hypothetical protein